MKVLPHLEHVSTRHCELSGTVLTTSAIGLIFLCHSIHVCITSRSDIVSNVSYTDWWYIVTVAFVIAVILLDIPTTNAHPTVANVVRLRCVCCSCSGSWCISFLIFFFLFLVFGAAIYANKSQGCPGYQLGPEAKYNDRQHSG